jgi:hypothetical protein
MSIGGKLISPNDSQAESREDFQEFQEQRNPNSLRPVNPASSTGMISEADYLAYRGGAHAGAEFVPRLSSHYDQYLKSYAAGAAYKSIPYSGMREEYSASRRYAHVEYGASSVRGLSPSGASAGGQMMIQTNPYGGMDQARRRALKAAAGAGGYWASGNEWVPEYY